LPSRAEHFNPAAHGLEMPNGLPYDGQRPVVNIMPVGDSITRGVYSPTLLVYDGYRGPLEDLLVAEGERFDFVGSQVDGSASLTRQHHEGHNGYTINDTAGYINTSLAAYRPQTILMMLGTNDLNAGGQAGAAARLGALLDQVFLAMPEVSVHVATLPPSLDGTLQPAVPVYNAQLPLVVNPRRAKGKQVYLCDVFAVLDPNADLYDGVHPNDAGYAKIAHVWAAALLGRPV
jgi:lysophospholipase L1-like esterase